MNKLTENEIKKYSEKIPKWQVDSDEISRVFEFESFIEAMGFVTKVAIIAEKRDHHPDIEINYNKVKLKLSTHSVNGLTEKDFELAIEIDKLI